MPGRLSAIAKTASRAGRITTVACALDMMIDEGSEPDAECAGLSCCEVLACTFGECAPSGAAGPCGDGGNECTLECDETARMCGSGFAPDTTFCSDRFGVASTCDGRGMCLIAG